MSATAEHPLAAEIAEYYEDPLGYVLDVFPWGTGELLHATGPDEWQTAALIEIGREVKARNFDGHTAVSPLRFCRASGHDIGKTTMAAWLVNWIKDTRPHSQGTITANTFTQLETKTWAAIKKWAKLAITREWWEMGSSMMYHREPGGRETWFVACQSSSEENSEAFAGQHAIYSTSYYIFDEASAIPDEIWRVAEGGLADGEPMLFAFGNPTRNTGQFFEACFGSKMHRWNHGSIDSRTSGISNKNTIEEWLQDYGEDSDFFRVRVRGLAPNASEQQLIGRDLVAGARGRIVKPLADEPLIVGVDVPDGGSAWFIARFRRGLDGHPCAPIRIPGSRCDRPMMIATLAKLMREGVLLANGERHPVAAMFVDSAFGSPVVERLHTLGYDLVQEVNFGGRSPDPHFANMRAYMWGKGLKEWLSRGCLAKDDAKIEVDLIGPGFHLNKSNALVLESKEEMKKRGVPSPDDGDALALTFAAPVAPVSQESEYEGTSQRHWLA
jgi:hypothetical protein